MECARVKELLSEYLDGVLDVEIKALVEEHLVLCKNCAQELASLKAYISGIHSLKEVKAPADFLKKVHTRIKRRFEFERIMRKLFVPARIKVPLQLVTVVAMLFLVIAVFNVMQPALKGRLALAPQDANRITVARKATEEPIKLARKSELAFKKEAAQFGAVSGYEAPPSIKEEKPIVLALSIKPEVSRMYYTEGMSREKVSRYKGMEAKDFEEADRVTKAPSAGAPMLRDQVVLPPSYLNEALFRVKRLIELAEGKVLSVEYEQETGLPQFVNAQISVQNFPALLEKLGQLGQFQEPLPSFDLQGEGSIPIRIKLTPAE